MTILEETDMTYYVAGAVWLPGTNLPGNVTGECCHRHRSPETAAACIARLDRAIKRGHGRDAYADRQIIRIDGTIRTVEGGLKTCCI